MIDLHSKTQRVSLVNFVMLGFEIMSNYWQLDVSICWSSHTRISVGSFPDRLSKNRAKDFDRQTGPVSFI